jgi:hypothetical protein
MAEAILHDEEMTLTKAENLLVVQLQETSQASNNAVEALDEPAFNQTVSF